MSNIREACQVLKNGGLVIFPSDTVYAAIVDAKNELAVQKLINFKNRPPGKPVSIFVKDFQMLKEVAKVNKKQENMLKKILPGPFTVILPSKKQISSKLEAENQTIGIRIVNNPFINQLLNEYKSPITATSANLAGRPPHYSINALVKTLPKNKKNLISYIFDSGKLPLNKPSTVINLTKDQIEVLRQGNKTIKEQYLSTKPEETKIIAQKIFNKYAQIKEKKPIIILIEGDLGTGKTIFVKGIAELFNINNIISPSYVIYYEYKINNQDFKYFYHFDLYNLQEEQEFEHLNFENILNEKNLICIEWGNKSQIIYKKFAKKTQFIKIKIITENKKNQRKITIN